MTGELPAVVDLGRLHPVRFRRSGTGITAYCDNLGCARWRVHLEDDHTMAELVRLAAEHSGIEWPP